MGALSCAASGELRGQESVLAMVGSGRLAVKVFPHGWGSKWRKPHFQPPVDVTPAVCSPPTQSFGLRNMVSRLNCCGVLSWEQFSSPQFCCFTEKPASLAVLARACCRYEQLAASDKSHRAFPAVYCVSQPSCRIMRTGRGGSMVVLVCAGGSVLKTTHP